MSLELNLNFPDPKHVVVSLIGDNAREETELLEFTSPISDKGHQHFRWYLEEYPTQYSTEVDIETAQQIAKQLPVLGNALFNKVFSKRSPVRLLKKFRDKKEHGRLLTITANHLAILTLPWELLHDSVKGGNFLIYSTPGISIRRRIAGIRKQAFQIKPKKQLHLLFVLSRPTNAGFIDAHANAQAVLDAVDKRATGRVTVEFLRPATLKTLHNRLTNKELPHVDILHFDGHCFFDNEGNLEKEAKAGFQMLSADLKQEAAAVEMGKNTSYLSLEKDNGERQLVPAPLLANLLHRQQVALVILSAGQSMVTGKEKDVSSVAVSLTAMGVPFVLAMNDSMLVPATQKFFQTFYECLAQGQKIGTALENGRFALSENTERRDIQRLTETLTIHLHDWFLPTLYQQEHDTALLIQMLPEEETEISQTKPFLASNLLPLQAAGFFGRQRELWQVERWFVRGTRRITITGVDGQGKTSLAQQAGRWLQRSGLFQRVVVVDYGHCQGLDPVSMAVSMIATVLQKNLLDVDAATQALRRVPTLVILDNLETLKTVTHQPSPSKTPENAPHVLVGTDNGESENATLFNVLEREDKGEGENATTFFNLFDGEGKGDGENAVSLNAIPPKNNQGEGENTSFFKVLEGEVKDQGEADKLASNALSFDGKVQSEEKKSVSNAFFFDGKGEGEKLASPNNAIFVDGKGEGGDKLAKLLSFDGKGKGKREKSADTDSIALGGTGENENPPSLIIDDGDSNAFVFEIEYSGGSENAAKVQAGNEEYKGKGQNEKVAAALSSLSLAGKAKKTENTAAPNAPLSLLEEKTGGYKKTQAIQGKSQAGEKTAEIPQPADEPLKKLLDAAKKWSEAGQSRVIIITRQPSLNHPDYPTKGGLKHGQLSLGRLGNIDALRYFEILMTLPPKSSYAMPKREEVENLFEQIDYHPLSINLITYQLKNSGINVLSERIRTWSAKLPHDLHPADRPLYVSLNLYLEMLELQVRPWLLRLGVFQCGAFENVLQAITEVPDTLWQALREALEATNLMRYENVEGVTVPYLKFHSALAPVLWTRLSSEEQKSLTGRYCHGYHELSRFLYDGDNNNPHQARAIELKELPNLLQVVHQALETGEDWVEELIEHVKSFLNDFGLKSYHEEFTAQRTEENLASPSDSPDWLPARSKEGEQFYTAGKYQEAQTVFQDILDKLGETTSYERCVVLAWLGRTLAEQSELELSADYFKEALAGLEQLEPSRQVTRKIGRVQSYLATVLMNLKEYEGATEAYEAALPIVKELGETRSEAAIHGQLGTLNKLQDNPKEATQHYQAAVTLFQQMKEPKAEATAWLQLGMLHEDAKQWEAAKQAYQQAAPIFEGQGDRNNAANTWSQLAHVNKALGNLPEAENGYHKAIEGYKARENWLGVSVGFSNLAELLKNQPHRLDEARQLAEAGLSIDKTLNPEVVEIWKTYTLLAKIAVLQNDTAQAQTYRRLAREAKAKSARTHPELQQHKRFVEAVVATFAQPKLRKQLESMLQQREQKGWVKLVAATRRLLDGERDWNKLCESEGLDLEDAMIVLGIRQQIGNK
ncbi:MAG: hypothetical protein DRR19_06605 [Candidatus Parabeggiatoa sp. nov. 1]|nr:MAG: hypothetical protein DRR19_06605 [Gammaproteobacteria bacterium]